MTSPFSRHGSLHREKALLMWENFPHSPPLKRIYNFAMIDAIYQRSLMSEYRLRTVTRA